MPFLIGTDEAGYGPNLGPLVVSATVWEVADGIDGSALYPRLRRVVTAATNRATKQRVVWADSKAIYKNGCGLDHLERGVLAALVLVGHFPREWCELWHWLDPECAPRINHLPWHMGYSAALPLWMTDEDFTGLVDSLRVGLHVAGVRLVALLCRAVFPGEFNSLVGQCGTKSDALSQITLGLVADALRLVPHGAAHVFCDKHGARNHYLPHLQAQFSENWIEVRRESAAESVYRFKGSQQCVEIGFYVAGERFLPTALASMTAKYLRETAMRPFNEFWCARVPGLAPTAGYPVDAWRFKEQIAAVQRELEIDDRILWRCR